jgi:Cu/Ag efflux pump CusA
VTPALCLILLDKAGIEKRESPLVPWLKRHYAAVLERVIKGPRVAYATCFVILVAGVGVWPFLGAALLPEFKERDFLMHWVPAEGTSHPETFRITQAASRELRAIPGVRNFGAHVGRAVGGDEPYGINFTENWISVDPNVDYDKTRASVESAVAGYPGLYRDVQTYLKERIKEVLTGAGESVVVRIFGPDLQGQRKSAKLVEDAMKDIPGLIDWHMEQSVGVPQIEVKVKLEEAARHGLKPGDVRRVVNYLMSGLEVTDIH